MHNHKVHETLRVLSSAAGGYWRFLNVWRLRIIDFQLIFVMTSSLRACSHPLGKICNMLMISKADWIQSLVPQLLHSFNGLRFKRLVWIHHWSSMPQNVQIELETFSDMRIQNRFPWKTRAFLAQMWVYVGNPKSIPWAFTTASTEPRAMKFSLSASKWTSFSTFSCGAVGQALSPLNVKQVMTEPVFHYFAYHIIVLHVIPVLHSRLNSYYVYLNLNLNLFILLTMLSLQLTFNFRDQKW